MVKSGLEVYLGVARHRLTKQRVGLLCHPASVNRQLQHAAVLLQNAGVRLMALFAPEHGLWGTAQDQVPVRSGRAFGLPVRSLYDQDRVPSRKDLSDLDILLCDLQDIGSRYYTFVWTLALTLRVCAQWGKRVIVLDRPNPLGGKVLEGNVLDPAFASFVGMFPVPVRHGMTIGELALWMNQRFQWGCPLEVIPLQGWRRWMWWDDTGLPWIPPSPNMPTLDTAIVYPGSCLVEGTNLSEGRGTARPFEWMGAPFVHPERIAQAMNAYRLPGVLFRACRFQPAFHKWRGQPCGGIQIHVADRRLFKPYRTGLRLIEAFRRLYPRRFAWRKPPYEGERRKRPIDILCGTDAVRHTLEDGGSLRDLEKSWERGLTAFVASRRTFLLYR